MQTIKLYDIVWQSRNAGASPAGNVRTEIYMSGCRRGASGSPCEGCCNSQIWDDSKARDLPVGMVVSEIESKSLPRYVTIVGGEPTDQPEALMELCRQLHGKGYHIMVFTWHEKEWLEKNFAAEDLDNIDIWITGPYEKDKHIADYALEDGIHNVIGSANQSIVMREPGRFVYSVKAGLLESMSMTKDNLVVFGMGKAAKNG